MTKQTVRDFFKQFPDDDTCLQHLFDVRYGDSHECKKCGTIGKFHRLKDHKAFSCQKCGDHIHPMAGTIYEGSTTPLQLWFYAMFLFTKSRNGVSGKELQRQLGVTYKTAWRMGHKIREHMARVDGDAPLGGSGKIVEVDETYIGGRKKGAYGGKGKAIVQGMLEHGGEIITHVTTDTKSKTLIKNITDHVKSGTEIHTDELPAYSRLSYSTEYTHKKVNHAGKQYVGPKGETTNSIEGFFMHLKRTIKGTHIWVSAKHLHSYTGEAEFIYNRRNEPHRILNDLLYGYPKG
ncbi:IS1595 family transposase [Hellea sp.]|nr:IS1595 family transposase [Hellea sp.]